MLEKYYDQAASLLLPAGEYMPFPEIDDREVWEHLHPQQKEFYMALAEKYLDYDWPVIPATRYLDYYRNGNRSRYTQMETKRRSALMALVMGECIENQGRFLDDIVNGIWVILDEASWVGPAHNGFYPAIENNLRPLPLTFPQEVLWPDHFAGDTGCFMAVVGRFLRKRLDAIAPQIYERLNYELHRRIIRPFVEHDDFTWMGNFDLPHGCINNWTPWVTSNCLAVTTLMSEDEEIRAKAVQKAMKMVDLYLTTVHEDGGCEEGSRYWGVAATALFANLELIHGLTGGKVDVYHEKKLFNFASFAVKMHIKDYNFTMFSDSDRNVRPNMQSMYYVAQKMENEACMRLALFMRPKTYSERLNPDNLYSHAFMTLRELFTYTDFAAIPAEPASYDADGWFEGIQMMSAREKAGTAEGLYFSAKAGTNGESHNHNDIGTYLVYSDGMPAIIDMGAGDYTASSFSAQRYELNKNTTSAYHNLMLIDGKEQQVGKEYHAENVCYEKGDSIVRFGMDLKTAFPSEAPIERLHRQYTFDRQNACIQYTDEYKLTQEAPMEEILMTALEPQITEEGLIIPVEEGRFLRAQFSEGWTPEVTLFDVSSNGLFVRDWKGKVYRTILRADQKVLEGSFTMTITRD